MRTRLQQNQFVIIEQLLMVMGEKDVHGQVYVLNVSITAHHQESIAESRPRDKKHHRTESIAKSRARDKKHHRTESIAKSRARDKKHHRTESIAKSRARDKKHLMEIHLIIVNIFPI